MPLEEDSWVSQPKLFKDLIGGENKENMSPQFNTCQCKWAQYLFNGQQIPQATQCGITTKDTIKLQRVISERGSPTPTPSRQVAQWNTEAKTQGL